MATRRPPPRFEQFVAVRRFQPTIAFSPDARRVLFVTDVSGRFNLWRSALGGGWPEQLTSFEDETVRAVTVAPDGTIVFAADRHGDEFHQLYALEARGGWPERLTDAPQVQHFVGQRGWSPDGRTLAYASNARRAQDMDIWLRDVESGETRYLFGGEKFCAAPSWSPDGAHVLVLEFKTNTAQALWLVDAVTGDARELTPPDPNEEVRWFAGPWLPDGSGVYVVTDVEREFLALATLSLDGRLTLVDAPDADVEHVDASGDGRVRVHAVNERGWSRLVVHDLQRDSALPAPELPRGTLGFEPAVAVSGDGGRAAVLWSSATRGVELYVWDTATGRARRLLDHFVGGLRPRDLVEPDVVSIPSFDREFDAWTYRPRRRGRRPVVLSVHGGPEAQERPVYQPLYQYLASRGIAVLAPNIRGSTGYGKTFQRLIHRDWGGGELRDLEHAVRWLREQEWADVDRLGVFGGSFGGFAVLSCIARLPDLWRAAVDVFGPSSLLTLVQSAPPTWHHYVRAVVGDAEADRELLLERSPITYADDVRTPVLVIQGAMDPRVVKNESDQLVERLRALGREVEYVVFDDEGHGFTKRENQVRAFRLAAEWFESRLL